MDLRFGLDPELRDHIVADLISSVGQEVSMKFSFCILFAVSNLLAFGQPHSIEPADALAKLSFMQGDWAGKQDFDTGGVVSGDETIEQAGDALFELVLKVASGEVRTKAELLAQDDFIPWKKGVSL